MQKCHNILEMFLKTIIFFVFYFLTIVSVIFYIHFSGYSKETVDTNTTPYSGITLELYNNLNNSHIE